MFGYAPWWNWKGEDGPFVVRSVIKLIGSHMQSEPLARTSSLELLDLKLDVGAVIAQDEGDNDDVPMPRLQGGHSVHVLRQALQRALQAPSQVPHAAP